MCMNNKLYLTLLHSERLNSEHSESLLHTECNRVNVHDINMTMNDNFITVRNMQVKHLVGMNFCTGFKKSGR